MLNVIQIFRLECFYSRNLIETKKTMNDDFLTMNDH